MYSTKNLLEMLSITTALLAIMCSCGTDAPAGEIADFDSAQSIIVPHKLELPTVPDSITNISERAAYAALHFWDNLDFCSSASTDTAFMEQNFANFAAILSMATPADVDKAVAHLVSESTHGGRPTFDLMYYIASKYLDEPDSPMRNEELYIPFLRHITKNPILSPTEQKRPAFRLEQALKNRPGLKAADFEFDLPDGTSSTLHSKCISSGTTLLIFYDPDCDHCKEVMSIIAATPLQAGVQVLAIDFIDDRDLWLQNASALPANWINGLATTPIEDEGLYYMATSPTLYLIDSENRVILKDPDYSQVLDLIAAR